MSNLRSARDSLAAELAHARQGLAFYDARVHALEETLATLDNLNAEGDIGDKPRRQGRPARAEQTEAVARGGRGRKQSGGLPATGKEFWTSLVTNEPRSTREILEAAIQTLGIDPSRDDLKKLSQRQANALHMLVKEKTISDSGSGRERRFFRPT
ncbi:hypothetical protein [Noviherbaspirillum aridicola]|uniref:Uncharacterized protein n=1 Tax=Noviherbaspirillum aridicola TaxID=2849687 RepID=A0ABQ4PZA1_9BURK|nr:hypothetical protein [Noviherbaspirillum aridicola]GIZ50228.1 hypothetical protein NCCP691_02420 [Noviherbaspirillum aridicola]